MCLCPNPNIKTNIIDFLSQLFCTQIIFWHNFNFLIFELLTQIFFFLLSFWMTIMTSKTCIWKIFGQQTCHKLFFFQVNNNRHILCARMSFAHYVVADMKYNKGVRSSLLYCTYVDVFIYILYTNKQEESYEKFIRVIRATFFLCWWHAACCLW